MSQEITPLSAAAQLGHDTMRDIANIKGLALLIEDEINQHAEANKDDIATYCFNITAAADRLQKTIDNFYLASKPKQEVPSTDIDSATSSLELE